MEVFRSMLLTDSPVEVMDMRTIEIDIDVFAAIWKLRLPNETSENQILRRVLGVEEATEHAKEPPYGRASSAKPAKPAKPAKEENSSMLTSYENRMLATGKIRWVDDVYQALTALGGHATLHEIYKAVEQRRKNAGRSVPKTLEATVRRTLEDRSSDSANFKGEDWFKKIGRGEWAIR